MLKYLIIGAGGTGNVMSSEVFYYHANIPSVGSASRNALIALTVAGRYTTLIRLKKNILPIKVKSKNMIYSFKSICFLVSPFLNS